MRHSTFFDVSPLRNTVPTLRPIERALPLLTAAFALFAAAAQLTAQVSQQQAQTLLNTRPELVVQLQQRLGSSGLTPAQVRDRLRAEGYDPGLLDAYLPGGRAAGAAPGADVLSAVQALGIADPTDVAGLRAMSGAGRALSAPTAPAEVPGAGAGALSDASARIFGLDVFRSATNQFVPNLEGPVDATYRVGPGDQLVLILTGDVELAHTLDVTREGFVVIPQVGQLPVASLTLAQIEDLLYARLGRVYSGVRRQNPSTHFSVSVSRLRSVQVFVIGDAAEPGAYRISSASTLLTALYAARGPADRGSLRRIELRRNGRVEQTFDAYDYLLRGDASRDVRLQNGDFIFIPVHGAQVRIDGEVTRPATYELKPGETLAELVAAAGGFTTTASARRLAVDRIVPAAQRAAAGRDRTVVELSLQAGAPLPAFALEAGDVVRVTRVADRVRNRVIVNGHVWQAGPQGLTQGLTLSEALRRAGGLKGDAYLGEVLVSRLRSDDTRLQLRATARDTSGAMLQDLALQEDDEITVFSRSGFRPAQYVAVAGAVRAGGRFPWREGLTLRDLALLAGGLVEGASVESVEIARLPEPRAEGELARTERVPIDATYLFESTGAPATAPSVALRPYDHVLFFRRPDWEQPREVAITGEVKFPGLYTLKSKSETLADLVQRAGGLTREANAYAAHFTRRQVVASYSTLRDSTPRIRIGVDLANALRDARASDNLFLQAGDALDVPPMRQTVEIRGEVNSSGATAIAPGAGLGFYLRGAGGPTAKADSRHAYVIQPNGKVETRRRVLWLVNLDPKPRAGSIVVVPQKDTTRAPGSSLATAATLAQVIASLAAVWAISR